MQVFIFADRCECVMVTSRYTKKVSEASIFCHKGLSLRASFKQVKMSSNDNKHENMHACIVPS